MSRKDTEIARLRNALAREQAAHEGTRKMLADLIAKQPAPLFPIYAPPVYVPPAISPLRIVPWWEQPTVAPLPSFTITTTCSAGAESVVYANSPPIGEHASVPSVWRA